MLLNLFAKKTKVKLDMKRKLRSSKAYFLYIEEGTQTHEPKVNSQRKVEKETRQASPLKLEKFDKIKKNFPSLRSEVGLKTFSHSKSLNQSDAKLTPMVSWRFAAV